MNTTTDICFRSVTIESNENSNCNSGALVVKGGILCQKNMKIERDLFSNCITTNQIKSSSNTLNLNTNILPSSDCLIGNDDSYLKKIFTKEIKSNFKIDGNLINCNNLNVQTSANIGATTQALDNGLFNSILEINSRDLCKQTSIVMRGENIYLVDPNTDVCYTHITPNNGINLNCDLNIGENQKNKIKLFSVQPSENRIIIGGDLIVAGSGIIKSFQKLEIENDSTLELTSQITILSIKSAKDINLKLSTNKLKPGHTRTITIQKNLNNVKIKLNEINFLINNGVEILYDGKKWVVINSF